MSFTPEQIQAELDRRAAARQQATPPQPVQASPQQAAPAPPVQGGFTPEQIQAELDRREQAKQQQIQAELGRRQEQAGVERRSAMEAREIEMLRKGTDRGTIERTLKEEFPRTEAQEIEDWGEESAAQRFIDSAGHRIVTGAHNVANKVDNFISDRFGDDVKGGGIIDDEGYATRKAKDDALAEVGGWAGSAGRFAGDSVLTAPVDAIGGRVLRPLAKAMRKAPGADEFIGKIRELSTKADDAIVGSVHKARAVEEANELGYTQAKLRRAVDNKRALREQRQADADMIRGHRRKRDEFNVKQTEEQAKLAKSRGEFADAKANKSELKRDANVKRAKSDATVKEWDDNREELDTIKYSTDALRGERKAIKADDLDTTEISKRIDEMDLQAGAMTRYQKHFRDLKIGQQRAANKAEKLSHKADIADKKMRIIDEKTAALPKAKERHTKAMKDKIATGRDRNLATREVAERKAERMVAGAKRGETVPKVLNEKDVTDKLTAEIEALGQMPQASRLKRAGATALESNLASRSLGSAASGAILADEGDSLEAGITAGLLGVVLGGKTDAVKVSAKGAVKAAEIFPYIWSMTQPKISHRYAGRKASNLIGARKKGLTRAVENFADYSDPGAVKRLFNHAKDTGTAEAANMWIKFTAPDEDDGDKKE